RVVDILRPAFVVDSEHRSSEVVSPLTWFSDAADCGFLPHSGLDFEPVFRPAPWQIPAFFSFRHDPLQTSFAAWKNSVPLSAPDNRHTSNGGVLERIAKGVSHRPSQLRQRLKTASVQPSERSSTTSRCCKGRHQSCLVSCYHDSARSSSQST